MMFNQPKRYEGVSKQSDDDWGGYWHDEIGWVGYFFAQLEWCSFWLADVIGSEEQKDMICKKRHFVDRCKFARLVLVPQLNEVALREDWSALLAEVAKTGVMRNKILHNPLNVNLKEMQSKGVTIDKGIRLLREKGGTVIELGDVQQFTENLRELNERMVELMERTAPAT